MPPLENPTIAGQVSILVVRTQALEQTISRLRLEADQARQSCYSYSMELNQVTQALAGMDAEEDAKADPESVKGWTRCGYCGEYNGEHTHDCQSDAAMNRTI